MRIVYRIALAKNVRDLSGKGARITGGRWNTRDMPVIYASESRSLAAMEFLVHVSLADIPPELKIISIGIPDSSIPKQIEPPDLPENWRKNPAPFLLADIGAKWVLSMESLLLRVPSAVMLHEYNILINPLYHDMKSVRIIEEETFFYDERLHQFGK